MNILVVTPFFKHDKNIASVRWTNISTRLAKKHNVIVVTQPHDDMDMNTEVFTDESGILVARINQKTAYEKFAVKYFGGATGDDWQTSSNSGDEAAQTKDSFVRKLKNRVLFASMKSKAKNYARYIVKNVIPAGTKVDVVISSACPFIEMMFGYELKKQLKCKWISDFRDLPFTKVESDDEKQMQFIMDKYLRIADAVVTIASRGKMYLVEEGLSCADKTHVITNGFSMLDARESVYVDDKKLHIVHTGSLYGGVRKADLLFKAIQIAKNNNPFFDYILECAGGNNETIVSTAKNYGEEVNVKNYGFIPREKALNLQARADILLALSHKRPGTLAAKLFEYVLNKKPIVLISCGKGECSDETDFVRNINLGIAADEVNFEQDTHSLAEYLLKQFELKSNSSTLEYSPDLSMIVEYDHDNLVKKFENLFVEIQMKG
ncbi:MAG: hypothetical protein IJ433_03490 [Ruminococcus sp.]|nr:hypothetical protein [Ruminococcus sp.]